MIKDILKISFAEYIGSAAEDGWLGNVFLESIGNGKLELKSEDGDPDLWSVVVHGRCADFGWLNRLPADVYVSNITNDENGCPQIDLIRRCPSFYRDGISDDDMNKVVDYFKGALGGRCGDFKLTLEAIKDEATIVETITNSEGDELGSEERDVPVCVGVKLHFSFRVLLPEEFTEADYYKDYCDEILKFVEDKLNKIYFGWKVYQDNDFSFEIVDY